MQPNKAILLILAVFLAICLMAMGTIIARSEENIKELPEGFGHPENHHEYFDSDCCNANDCEMIPREAVQRTMTGWYVRFYTKKYGGMVVEGLVAFGQEKETKKCMNGTCFGACSVPRMTTCGTGFNSQCWDYSKPASIRCLYIMPSSV